MIHWTCVILLSILTLAVATGWGLSKTRNEPVYPYREYSDNASIMISFDGGQVRLSHWWYYDNIRSALKATREGLGFGYLVNRIDTPQGVTLQIHRVWFPAMVAVALLGAYPSFVILSGIARRLHRRRRHRCRKCGYSLVGLPEPRCPECGAAVVIPDDVDVEQYSEPLPRSGLRTVAVTLAIFVAIGGGLVFFTTDAYKRLVSPIRQSNIAIPFGTLGPGVQAMKLNLLSRAPYSTSATRTLKRLTQIEQQLLTYGAGTTWPSTRPFVQPRVIAQGPPELVDGGSGCPKCGMHSALVKVDQPEMYWVFLPPPKAETRPTDQMVWMCTECRMFMVNPWTGDAHPKHDWCASCGYSTEDETGRPIPWPTCLCPSCGTRHWP